MKLNQKFLHILTRFPNRVIILSLLLAIFFGGYAFFNLGFDTNPDHLISPEEKYAADYMQFLKDFGDWEDIVVVVQTKNHVAEAKEFARALTEKIETQTIFFKSITSKIETSSLKKNAALFLEEKTLQDFAKLTENHPELIAGFFAIQSIDDYHAWLGALLAFIEKNPLASRDVLQEQDSLFKDLLQLPYSKEAQENFAPDNLFKKISHHASDPDGFITTQNGELLFLFVTPHKDFSRLDIIREPLDFLRTQIKILEKKYPNIKIGVTGRPVLQDDEAVSTGNDSLWAGMASLIFVTLLFFYYIRDLRLTCFSLAALAAAIAITAGIITFTIGSINLLTIVFAIILLGMGLDYGIHFLLDYQIIRHQHTTPIAAVTASLRENAVAIGLGAIVTAIGFSTGIFTDFLGLQQLGAILGGGILICALLQLTAFPALIIRFHTPFQKTNGRQKNPFAPIIWLCHLSVRHPLALFLISTLCILTALPLATSVHFDANLLKLQDPKLESVRYEKIISENSEKSTWFLSARSANLNEIKTWQEKLKKLSRVASTESILDYIPEQQNEKIKTTRRILNRINIQKNQIRFTKDGFTKILEQLDRWALQAATHNEPQAAKELLSLIEQIKKTRTDSQNLENIEKSFLLVLHPLQKAIFSSFLKPTGINEKDLPPLLLTRLKSAGGDYSLTITPRHNIWEWTALENFLTDVRQIIPNVTGAPVTTYEAALRMKSGFTQIGWLTASIVILILAFTFRNIKTALFIFASLVLTFATLLEFMGVAGISLNLANFFALPILIGSNVDHGIYMFHHYREHKNLEILFTHTVPPIFLSCAANIAGFVALGLVRHRGLSGFGWIMTAGTAISLLITLVWLPSVLVLFFNPERKLKNKYEAKTSPSSSRSIRRDVPEISGSGNRA